MIVLDGLLLYVYVGLIIWSGFVAPKASAEGACIFSKLVTMERV